MASEVGRDSSCTYSTCGQAGGLLILFLPYTLPSCVLSTGKQEALLAVSGGLVQFGLYSS